MKANLINIQNIFSEIPETWQKIQGYNLLDSSTHFNDGWRDVVVPQYNANTHKLSIDWVLIDDIVTKEVIEMTAQEVYDYADSLIPLVCTPKQLRIALMLSGISSQSVEDIINGLPESEDKEIVKISWHHAIDFERKNPLLIMMAQLIGLTEIQIKDIFVLAVTF